MFKLFRFIGLWFASLKGWGIALAVAPSIIAVIGGLFEGLPWAATVAYFTLALAGGLALVFFGMLVLEGAANYLTGRKEQKRIAEQIKALQSEGYHQIDTGTAAAIWAGTREEGNLWRHLRFRMIKAAITTGDIPGALIGGQPLTGGANIHTWMPLDRLVEYFISRGILNRKDMED